jgi:hypothetical protein
MQVNLTVDMQIPLIFNVVFPSSLGLLVALRLSFQSFPTLCHSFDSSNINYEVDEAHRVGIAAGPRTLFCFHRFSSGYGIGISKIESLERCS